MLADHQSPRFTCPHLPSPGVTSMSRHAWLLQNVGSGNWIQVIMLLKWALCHLLSFPPTLLVTGSRVPFVRHQKLEVFSEFCHSAWFVSVGFSWAPQRPGSQLAHSPLWLIGIFPNYLSGWWERRRVSLTMMVVLILQQSKQEPLPSDSGVYGQPSSNRTLPVDIWSSLWSGTRVGPQGPIPPAPSHHYTVNLATTINQNNKKAVKG